MSDKIIDMPIEEGLQNNYLTYAMSVIIGRYIPDVRDGLKPVHRRILYAMYERGVRANQKSRKSAKVVGDVLGNYHPHGDQAVYEALVRMAQDFSMRYTLIEGQGNFGSIDGDPAAAMRYTECRLEKLSEELITDIEKNTVDFIPNYDNSTEEPIVLPSSYPNLLVNGSTGIAVAMSTHIPPHNLTEIINATQAIIDDPDVSIDDLYMTHIKGPDFPTGGGIFGLDGVRKAYKTGKGTFYIRGKHSFENLKSGREAIIITEIPYVVKKTTLIEKIASLVRDEKIKGIAEIRDESNKEGIRIVLELKKNTIANVILNQLYLHTPMQTSFGINMLAIVDQKPRQLNLKEILQYFITHRKEVLIRKTQYDLDKAQQRLHIVEGLLSAIDNLDEVIKIIRASQTAKEAKTNLIERFELSDAQSQAILDLRLQKLTALERLSLEDEHKDLLEKISFFENVLANDDVQYGIIREDLQIIKEKYGDARKTEILQNASKEIDIESTIKPEDCAVIVSSEGMIKRAELKSFRTQKRGGRGKIGANIREDENIEHFIISNTLNYLVFFTDQGKAYYLKVYEIPEGSIVSRGKSLKGFLNLEQDEKIQSYLEVKDFTENEFSFFITRKGKVKKTPLYDFRNAKRRGVTAITLEEGDELVKAMKTTGDQEIFLATSKGKGLRVKEKEIRSMGRAARGVIGIKTRGDDYVIGATLLEEGNSLFAITANGFGKRVSFDDFKAHSRGTMGQRYYSVSDKTGRVTVIAKASEDSQIIIITRLGMTIRTKMSEIREMGKDARGNTLIKLKNKDDEVADVAILDNE
jgi:DNA gyrase subunit A